MAGNGKTGDDSDRELRGGENTTSGYETKEHAALNRAMRLSRRQTLGDAIQGRGARRNASGKRNHGLALQAYRSREYQEDDETGEEGEEPT
jgi:hypothetical protein